MTTLYRITQKDWEGPYIVEAVPELFSSDGRLQVDPGAVYPTEGSALTILGIKLALQIEERERLNEKAWVELEGVRGRLKELAEGATANES